MKKFFKEYELLIDLPTGEKKGDHFFFHVENSFEQKIWYQKGKLSDFDKTKWYEDYKSTGVKLSIEQMKEPFFKSVSKELDFYPPFPDKEKIKEFYHLIGESRLVNSVDTIRAINEIFYSDEFYNDVYELLKQKYNQKHGY